MKEKVMRKNSICAFVIIFATLLPGVRAPLSAQDRDSGGNDSEAVQGGYGWPQTIQSGDDTITVYQPQLETWKENQLSARAAVSVATRASSQPSYGVVFFNARTEVDRARGIVTLQNIEISRVNFPNKDMNIADYHKVISESVSRWPRELALSSLVADLAITRAESKAEERTGVRNNPPMILYSQKPAVLVLIDGAPALRAVPGSQLMRIINTRALVLFDANSAKYYLYLADHWMEAHDIEGPWGPANNPPASLAPALDAARQSKEIDLLDYKTQASETPSGGLSVFVSIRPAELIITRGKPDLQPIKGTQLLTCVNSDDNIFLYLNDQHYYLLIAGRWYRGRSLKSGPWTYVPGKSLPRDFAKIPENNPKGDVLASVPGTPDAQEAVIENSIPQTAEVRRSEARAQVTYDGDPEFKPIKGTPLKYAVNSPVPVIEVDEHSFFCVTNGVWFASPSPFGPWAVADRVPAVIYTIPPSCPISYVAYVRVYGSTPEVVYVGYTPGYLGALIGADGTVVYGTGYWYAPWIGSVWYGCPVTWGIGISFGWHLWGWGWGWWGWRPLFRPWWGPMWAWAPVWWHPWRWHSTGIIVHANVYNHWGTRVVAHSVFRSAPSRTIMRSRTYSYFSGRDGSVYRQGANGGWERYAGRGQWERHEWRGHPDSGRTEFTRRSQMHRDRGFGRDGGRQFNRSKGGGRRSAHQR
jgi:hypothetical protein